MFASESSLASLPMPEPAQRRASARLVEHIRTLIAARRAPLSLGEFVHCALYEPELGYYAAGTRKFGEHGDFVTAPELGSVFAQCIARGIRRVFNELGHHARRHAKVLELGAGSGRFAHDCLLALNAADAVPAAYEILEVSAELTARQRALLATLPEHLYQRVRWLRAPPQTPFEGVIFANEVIDALPMERFCVMPNGDVTMEFIEASDTGDEPLRSIPGPATAAIVSAVNTLRAGLLDRESWSLPYINEIRTGVGGWLQAVSAHLERGALLMVDYGADAAELYRADRRAGTLLCHYRHRAHDQVLLWPGLQDITSWVDFTQVAQAAVDLGWQLNGYTTQAQMLIDLELDNVVGARFEGMDATGQLQLAAEVRQLTLPGEMGERFKAISLSRGLSHGLLSPAHVGLERRL